MLYKNCVSEEIHVLVKKYYKKITQMSKLAKMMWILLMSVNCG